MDTSLRIDNTVLEALRLARSEMSVATRRSLGSYSDAVAALVEYWDHNKRDTHAITTGPVLASNAANANLLAGQPLE